MAMQSLSHHVVFCAVLPLEILSKVASSSVLFSQKRFVESGIEQCLLPLGHTEKLENSSHQAEQQWRVRK
jgi:hypothetical protein